MISGIAASRQAGDRYFLPRYLAQYADFEASQSRYTRAESLFDEATDIVNGMLVNVSGPSAESDLVATMNDLYLQHFRLEAQRGRTQSAFAVLEQARGRATADLLKAPSGAGPRIRRPHRAGTDPFCPPDFNCGSRSHVRIARNYSTRSSTRSKASDRSKLRTGIGR